MRTRHARRSEPVSPATLLHNAVIRDDLSQVAVVGCSCLSNPQLVLLLPRVIVKRSVSRVFRTKVKHAREWMRI